MGEGAIVSFTGDMRFLSNFYRVQVQLDGVVYNTVEHAYQAAKTELITVRNDIWMCSTPGQAKRIGARVKLRPDWENIKYVVMSGLVRQKFTKHRDLLSKLRDTYPAQLIEGNTWGDREWGAVYNKGVWVGKNMLGKILMQIREEYRLGVLI
jgi:hypothetical protein